MKATICNNIFFFIYLYVTTTVNFCVQGRFLKGADRTKRKPVIYDEDSSTFQHPKLIDSEYIGFQDRSSGIEVYDEEYIVILDDSVFGNRTSSKDYVATVQRILREKVGSGKVEHVYENLFKGVSITSLPLQKLKTFLDEDIVKYASPNLKVAADQFTQLSPTWGLDRLDQLNTRGDSRYTYAYDGSGVYVHIVDTGIQLDHDEFAARATCGFSVVPKDTKCTDELGHGTHVAGIIGGTTFGVAKNAQLIAVKVLDAKGEGSDASVVAGIDYVMGQKKLIPSRNIIMNMSLSGGKSTLLNDSINAAVDAGIISIAAAGNTKIDSCQTSPGSATKAITVGSTTSTDTVSDFSNFGLCIDIFAPGTSIISSYASLTSKRRNATLSGTSMSAAFASGVAALQLQKESGSTPQEVWTAIQGDSLSDRINFDGKRRRSPNRLLNVFYL